MQICDSITAWFHIHKYLTRFQTLMVAMMKINILACDVVHFGREVESFRKNLLSPLSGLSDRV